MNIIIKKYNKILIILLINKYLKENKKIVLKIDRF